MIKYFRLTSASSGSMAIGGTVTSGTTGSVLFIGAGPVLAQDNTNFFWDDTNNRLGVGTNSPAATIESMCTASTEIGLIVQGAASQSADLFQLLNSSGTKLYITTSDGTVSFLPDNITYTATKAEFVGNSTLTIDYASGTWQCFAPVGTVRFNQSGSTFGSISFFNFGMTVANVSTVVAKFGLVSIYADTGICTADAATLAGGQNYNSILIQPTLNSSGGGTATFARLTGVDITNTVDTGITVTSRRGIYIRTPTNNGTVTTGTAIQIDDQAGTGSTLFSLRILGSAVSRHVPKIKIGADSSPNVEVDVSGWINFNGEVRVSTQFDSTSTTLANVTGLSVTVASGRSYRFRAILFSDSSALGGYKFAIAGTATATAIIYNINTLNNATGAFTLSSRQTALGGSATSTTGTGEYTEITGLITVNAGGTLTVQFAQNTANGTSSVLVGSHFTVWDVA